VCSPLMGAALLTVPGVFDSLMATPNCQTFPKPRMVDLDNHFAVGDLAEWSMAVVLKTSGDRLYQDGYVSAA